MDKIQFLQIIQAYHPLISGSGRRIAELADMTYLEYQTVSKAIKKHSDDYIRIVDAVKKLHDIMLADIAQLEESLAA